MDKQRVNRLRSLGAVFAVLGVFDLLNERFLGGVSWLALATAIFVGSVPDKLWAKVLAGLLIAVAVAALVMRAM